MSIIKSLVIAFSMYSKIPMPHLELDEKDMKYVMGFFPLIGLITGALAYGWIYAGEILYVPDISRTLVLIILPVIITGGIHVDGYMDTCDALNSYGDREKKLAILKDSHIGAFAVIKLLVYYVLYFAAAFIVVQKAGNMQIIIMVFTFYLSRIISGLAAVNKCYSHKAGKYNACNTACIVCFMYVHVQYYHSNSCCHYSIPCFTLLQAYGI